MLLFILISCKDDPCRFIDDPSINYQIRILDAMSENDLLFGDQAIYHFDSIEYNNPNIIPDLHKSRFFISSFSDTLLSLEIFRNIEESYYLKWSSNDIDTIMIKTIEIGGCYGFSADSIALNGADFVKYESPFVILK